jgi:hypothetical protein
VVEVLAPRWGISRVVVVVVAKKGRGVVEKVQVLALLEVDSWSILGSYCPGTAAVSSPLPLPLSIPSEPPLFLL